jgi:hypothetical protein
VIRFDVDMGIHQSKPGMMLLISICFGMMVSIDGSFAWLGRMEGRGTILLGVFSFEKFWLWKG